MSYVQISKNTVVSKKQHGCIWCPDSIPIGTSHIVQIGVYDGDFQSNRFHAECFDAAMEHFKTSGEDLIYPHECKRGTQDHA